MKGFSHLVFTSPWKPKGLNLNPKCSERYKLCTQQSVPIIIITTFLAQFFGRIIFLQCDVDFLHSHSLFLLPGIMFSYFEKVVVADG